MKDLSNINEYQLAMETFECYCIYRRYAWVVINVSENDTLKLLCPQEQFFFQRHCVTAQFLQENNYYDYVLFVDSDMGVINPKRRIEEYIMDDKDIIFYNRIWNFEVMAGSYLAKNTIFVINFLRMWANYNYRLPHSFHGSDNAAIHVCYLFTYEACVRAQLETNKKWKKKVSVLPKGQSWARDGWLTDSKWSEEDFIFHGWQKRRLNKKAFASWKLPFLSTKFNMSLCGTNSYIENWKYNQTFARNPNEIRAELDTIITLNEFEYYKEKQNAGEILANLTKNELVWHNFTNQHIQ
uniref:Nucleotide-diphospho-sugar transferase domain-containing protein n=2 Tax=Onchocerca TaxID=6281 RepID=A0A2K6VQS6_ONCVO